MGIIERYNREFANCLESIADLINVGVEKIDVINRYNRVVTESIVFSKDNTYVVNIVMKYLDLITTKIISKIVYSKFFAYFNVFFDNVKDDIRYMRILQDTLKMVLSSDKSELKERIIDELTERHPELIKCISDEGENIMHHICYVSRYEYYEKYFYLYPELMQCPDNNGVLPIAKCTYNKEDGSCKIIRSYLDNVNNINPDTLLDMATDFVFPNEFIWEIIEKLSCDTSRLTRILVYLVSCYDMPINTIEHLIYHGADVKAELDEGQPLLTRFCCIDDTPSFELLEQNGAIVNEEVFKELCLVNNVELAKRIYYEYKINIKCLSIHLLIFFLQTYKVRSILFNFLLDIHEFDVTIKTDDGETLLFYYSNFNYGPIRDTGILIKLIRKGINPYDIDKKGMCFFHGCMNLDDIKNLEEIGFDLSLKSARHDTIMEMTYMPFNSIFELRYHEETFRKECEIVYNKFLINHSDIRDMYINQFMHDLIEQQKTTNFKEVVEILAEDYNIKLEDGIVFFAYSL